jgi:linearmycin/streptolysin S transport system permease protein
VTRALAVTWVMWRVVRSNLANIVFVIAIPLAIAALLASIYTAVAGREQRLGVVAEGNGPVSKQLAIQLSADPALRVTTYRSLSAALHDVRTRKLDGAVLIPKAVDDPRAGVTYVQLFGAPGIAAPTGLRAGVELATAETAARLVVGRSLAPGDPLGGLAAADQRASAAGVDRAQPIDTAARARQQKSLALVGAMVLFVFINTLAAGADFSSLRELQVFARLRSTPMTSRHTVGGFTVYLATFGVVQGLLVAVVGTAALGLHWHDPVLAAAVVVAVGVAAGCMASCVATFLPSWPTGAIAGGLLAFVLGMLGGCLWPLSLVGPVMQTVSNVAPQAWALDALSSVIHGGGLAGVARPLAVLAVMSSGFAAIAIVRMRHSVNASA